MALITEAIRESNFELIRDRIGEILATELPNQATLNAQEELNATVFVECSTPFDKSDTPCINVMLSNGDYDNQTVVKTDGTYTYFIDVYTSSKETSGDTSDYLSTKNLHRLLGVCSKILEHQKYQTLGYERPSIEHRSVRSINISMPENRQDAYMIMMGRITFTVRIPENKSLLTANNIDGYSTNVKLSLTEKGYIFTSSD